MGNYYHIRTGIKKRYNQAAQSTKNAIFATLAAAAAGLVVALVPAGASSGSPAASSWHLGYYTPSVHGALSNSKVANDSSGNPAFNFTDQPNTALLITDQKAKNPTLLGDLTGKTLAANFTISGATGAFTYYGEGTPSNPCGTPASTRLYFETSNAGGFDPTHYWWSNPASAVLANGSFTVSANIDPSQWSDWNGQAGTTVPAQFAEASSHVTGVGLSYGGGCFFENGVGTSDGSGTFTLSSYTATP